MALFIIKLEDRVLYDATAVALIAQSIGNHAGEVNHTQMPSDASALAVEPNDTQMDAVDYDHEEGGAFIYVTDHNGSGFLHMVSSALAVQTLTQSQQTDQEQIRNPLSSADSTKHIGDNFGHGMSNEALSFRLVDGEPQLPRQTREINYSDALDALNFVQDHSDPESIE